jgi:hypothetical protein
MLAPLKLLVVSKVLALLCIRKSNLHTLADPTDVWCPLQVLRKILHLTSWTSCSALAYKLSCSWLLDVWLKQRQMSEDWSLFGPTAQYGLFSVAFLAGAR